MAVSKSLRYQILRRDNHTCRYCGRSAPEVKLTVDHVLPEALGGADVASNLAQELDAFAQNGEPLAHWVSEQVWARSINTDEHAQV